MAPIRVGFLGLSKSGWAPNAHLPFLKISPDYEIVALCNSTVQSAKEAITLYNLPDTVKAYGDPQDLANDKDVDLVVCSVRVDRHLETISPALKAGKDVFVEWPLGASASQARELLKLKKEGGVKKAVVGLQARRAPIVHKVKELIDAGKIGKVLSSTWSGTAGALGLDATQAYEYIGRREVGGNLVTIHSGHSWDYIQYVLGYGFKSAHSILSNRRPTIKLLDSTGKVVEEKHAKTSDDTIFLQGLISSSSSPGDGIPFSYTLRGGKPFPSTNGLTWSIYGQTGEILVTASSPFLQIGYEDMKIQLHDFASDKVEEVDFAELEKLGDLPMPGRNVARVYRALAQGKESCTFEDAVERHEFIEGLYRDNGYTEGT